MTEVARPAPPKTGSSEPVPAGWYTADLVAAAAGASYRQLDHWCTKGYLGEPKLSPGSGYRRLFSSEEALKVAVLAKLARHGMAVASVPIDQVIETGVFGSGPVQIRVDVDALRAKLAAALDEGISE